MKVPAKPTSSPISSDDASYFGRAVGGLHFSDRGSRWIKAAFVVAAIVYFICIAKLEVGPINRWSNDVMLLLDGGWRIMNGQVPHRDFYLALGPLEYMITAGGMFLAHGSPQGIAIGNVFFGAIVGIWGWFLSRKRMPVLPALLVVAWLILTATSPTPIGSESSVLSCAMIYNRHGYALLGLVLVECAFMSERSRFSGGFSSGLALALLGFLKLNFFGVAGLLLLATVPMRREEFNRVWGALFGIVCTVAVFTLYLHSAIAAFFSDMLFAIHSRGSMLSLAGAAVTISKYAETEIVILAVVLTVVVILLTVSRGLWQRQTVRMVLLGGLVIATGPFFCQTDAYESGCTLAALWVILLLAVLGAAYPLSKEKTAIAAVIVLSLVGVVADFAFDAHCVLNLARASTASQKAMSARIAGHGMDGLRFIDSNDQESNQNGHAYVATLDDGVALLSRSSRPDESILALGFHNPFSYILRRKPAVGGSPWLLIGNNLSKTNMPGAERVFGNADLMMVPDYESSHRPSDQFIEGKYDSYLKQHFDFVDRSQSWLLYRRKK